MSTAVVEPPTHAATKSTSRGLVIGIGLILLAAHVPLLFAHFRGLWLKPHYQLFPIVLVGAFLLLWPTASMAPAKAGVLFPAIALLGVGAGLIGLGALAEAGEWTVLGAAPNWIAAGGIVMFASIPLVIFLGTAAPYLTNSQPARGRTWVIIDIVLFAGVVFFGSLPGSAFSILVLIAALAYTLGGSLLLRRCLPALAFLLLVVGPPLSLDTKLVQKLQELAAGVSSKLLDQMGVYHILNGVVIQVGEKKYEVEGACSGISSLLSTLACVLFYVLYFRIHWFRATLLTLSAMLWVMVNNILRIIGITAAGTLWKIDLANGLPHQLFGILLFALTLVLLWSTDRLLMFFGRSDEPHRRFEPATVAPSVPAVETAFGIPGAYYKSLAIAAVFAVLTGIQGAEIAAIASQAPYSGSALSGLYKKVTVDTLPERLGRWTRPAKLEEFARPTGSPLGEFSQTWRYGLDRTQTNFKSEIFISFDYPYPEFHDIRVCYRNIGWYDTKTELFKAPTGDNRPDLECVRVKLYKPYEQYGNLWFCQFDQDGLPIEPTDMFPKPLMEKFTDRIVHGATRWQRLLSPGRAEKIATGSGSIVQVQMLFETKHELSDAENANLEAMFVEAAKRLRARAADLKLKPQ